MEPQFLHVLKWVHLTLWGCGTNVWCLVMVTGSSLGRGSVATAGCSQQVIRLRPGEAGEMVVGKLGPRLQDPQVSFHPRKNLVMEI